jgi:acetyltransferase-like isoleucine patch superfamily enzyme
MDVRRLAMVAGYGIRALAQLVRDQVFDYTVPALKLAHFGKGSYLHSRCSLRSPENISIGDSVSVGPGTSLWASPNAKLVLQDDVVIGPSVSIFTSSRGFKELDIPIIKQPWVEADVTIGKGVALFASVVVLCGVTIGEGAVIGAGSIVTADVPAFAVVVGAPARVIRSRK